MKYRPDVDGLRALAVAAVVAFHADPAWLPGGFVGVDIFFVISGFLITSIIVRALLAGSFSIGTFYARRARRLAPALVVMLATVWTFGWFTLLVGEFEQLGRHVLASAAFVMNLALWTEVGYFDSAADQKPLLHMWSLGVEEQFYLVWPLLLRLSWGRIRILWVVLSVLAASFAINVITTASSPATAFYWPHTRLWQLAMGAALSVAGFESALGTPGRANVLAATGLLAILLSYVGFSQATPYPGWAALLPTVGALCLLGAGPTAWVNRVVLASPPVVWVGLISYPLYLWHWPIITFLRNVTNGPMPASDLAAAVILSVALAWLVYRFVEQPIRRGSGRRAVFATASVLVLLAGVGGAGAFVWRHASQLPPRFTARLQALADFHYEYEDDYRERRCYLMPNQAPGALASECAEVAPATAPLVVLWGDSHAAHLYPGFAHLQRSRGFRTAQWTGARCPPIVGIATPEQPQCGPLNQQVIATIGQWRPDVVVLAARWRLYDLSALPSTLAAFKGLPVGRVVVVGPVPNWTTRVPRVLFNYVQRHPLAATPEYVSEGLAEYLPELDQELRTIVEAAGATYVSALEALCTSQGCLTAIEGDITRLSTWDDSHLTAAGSEALATRLASQILPATAQSQAPR